MRLFEKHVQAQVLELATGRRLDRSERRSVVRRIPKPSVEASRWWEHSSTSADEEAEQLDARLEDEDTFGRWKPGEMN